MNYFIKYTSVYHKKIIIYNKKAIAHHRLFDAIQQLYPGKY